MSFRWIGGLAVAALLVPSTAMAGGKVAWLDEVVQEVILEARSGGKALAEGRGDGSTARAGGPAVRPRGRRGARSPGPAVGQIWPAQPRTGSSPPPKPSCRPGSTAWSGPSPELARELQEPRARPRRRSSSRWAKRRRTLPAATRRPVRLKRWSGSLGTEGTGRRPGLR